MQHSPVGSGTDVLTVFQGPLKTLKLSDGSGLSHAGVLVAN